MPYLRHYRDKSWLAFRKILSFCKQCISSMISDACIRATIYLCYLWCHSSWCTIMKSSGLCVFFWCHRRMWLLSNDTWRLIGLKAIAKYGYPWWLHASHLLPSVQQLQMRRSGIQMVVFRYRRHTHTRSPISLDFSHQDSLWPTLAVETKHWDVRTHAHTPFVLMLS